MKVVFVFYGEWIVARLYFPRKVLVMAYAKKIIETTSLQEKERFFLRDILTSRLVRTWVPYCPKKNPTRRPNTHRHVYLYVH